MAKHTLPEEGFPLRELFHTQRVPPVGPAPASCWAARDLVMMASSVLRRIP